ncbi:MAG TPA: VOC family protein, partial [Stellaceae bacterium]|nr:VOC family protein [Stellaceae bacterium]
MKIERLDHLNLTVADIAKTCDFYTKVLGMEVVSWGEGRAALRFGDQKINLDPAQEARMHDGGKRMPAHLCFVTDAPLGDITAHLETCGVPIAMGPGPRSG